MAKFMAELLQIAQFCGYDETLEEMLRDRLVCGANDTRIQCRLLAEPEPLTLKSAFEVAQAIEMAERDTKDLVVTQGHTTVYRLQRASSKAVTRQTSCYHCKRKHDPATCKYKDAKCHAWLW